METLWQKNRILYYSGIRKLPKIVWSIQQLPNKCLLNRWIHQLGRMASGKRRLESVSSSINKLSRTGRKSAIFFQVLISLLCRSQPLWIEGLLALGPYSTVTSSFGLTCFVSSSCCLSISLRGNKKAWLLVSLCHRLAFWACLNHLISLGFHL